MRKRAVPRAPDESDVSLLGPAGRRRYRRAFDLAPAFPFGAAFFLAVGFFAPGLALCLGLSITFAFAAPLGLPATDFDPRGWVS